MLILVGVTVNVALNGGLFQSANKATKDTEKYSILEQIIAMAKFKDNGDINVKETVEEIAKTFTVDPNTVEEGATEVSIEVTGKKGTYNYKITTTEITEDFNMYGVCYKATMEDIVAKQYFFKCGVAIQEISGYTGFLSPMNGIYCYNCIFENNEVLYTNRNPLATDFTRDFSSCKFNFGDSWLDGVRTEEQYNYDPQKNEGLGIYTNNAIYLSSKSLIWIDASDIKFFSSGLQSISISDVETPEALQTAIKNAGYNINILNEGKTITFNKVGETDIEYKLIEELRQVKS